MVGVSDETKAEERVEAIFSKMDDNKDGKLSVIEFVEGTKDDPAIRQLLQVWWSESNDHVQGGPKNKQISKGFTISPWNLLVLFWPNAHPVYSTSPALS